MTDDDKSVGVVTLWTPEIAIWAAPHAADKAAYCERWGFSFYSYDGTLDPSRAPTWSKIIALRAQLASHDWLLWTDADAVVTNPRFDVRELCDDAYDLVVTHDHAGFNAGNFLLRNTERSHAFLAEVWDEDVRTFHYEQTAMARVMERSPELRVKVAPKRSMNSYWFDHEPGDFIVHAAGEPPGEKVGLLQGYRAVTRAREALVADEPCHDGRRAAVMTCCVGSAGDRYFAALGPWLEGVARSGWRGDVLVFTNRPQEVAATADRLQLSPCVLAVDDPRSPADPYRQKAAAAIAALETYDEVLFADVDVVLRRDPAGWAFGYDRMMVSQDVFGLFHPCMLRAWYPERADRGEPGLNAGLWSVGRQHMARSLVPWHDEMTRRIEADDWPVQPTLNDQPQLNKLWFEGEVELGLFPREWVAYPSTPGWPANAGDPWAVHCCGVDDCEQAMRRWLRTMSTCAVTTSAGATSLVQRLLDR